MYTLPVNPSSKFCTVDWINMNKLINTYCLFLLKIQNHGHDLRVPANDALVSLSLND